MHLLDKVLAERGRPLLPELSKTEPKVMCSQRTVLLAEDNDDLRYVMECSLMAMGYAVVACADGQFASTAFHSHPVIDILLTDFEMPRRSGIELARELTASHPALPVILITGSLLSSATMQEIYVRRWIYVSKPCRFPALESTLNDVLMRERHIAA